MKFDRHTIVLLIRPPDAPELSADEAAAIQDAHLASQANLHAHGHLVVAGPFAGQDDERLRGIAVMASSPSRRAASTLPTRRCARVDWPCRS